MTSGGDRRYDDAALPLSRTPKVDDDVRAELDFHIDQRAAELVATGLPASDARAQATSLFGDRAAIEAACRTIERRRRYQSWRQFRWQSLWQDMAGGVRLLRKSPMFTAAAVLTLAIGIGAIAAVFSLLNRAILQPLAYPGANRLVSVSEKTERGHADLAWATAVELRARSRSFDALASYGAFTATVLGTSTPLRVQTAAVAAEFFSVFGVRARQGRLPLPEEHREGATPVVVVSHAFWRDRMGAPATLAGVQLRLDRVHEVIAVLPPSFDFPAAVQLWIPLELERQSSSHTAHNWQVIGRLRADVSPDAAQRELSAHIEQLRAIFQDDFDGVAARVTPLQDVLTANLKTRPWCARTHLRHCSGAARDAHRSTAGHACRMSHASSAAPELLARLGEVLGDGYRIERELPAGGLGRVVVAHEVTLQRRVVIKVVADASRGAEVRRFPQEILLSASLQHPHIVPVFAAGDVDGAAYFITPFIDGRSLRSLLDDAHPLRSSEITRRLRDLASAL